MNRGYRMRRQARRMRRYGMQPMIVMNSGDDFPDIAMVIIARWTWRYRSELAPFALSLTLALGGWLLHVSHPGCWPFLAASAVFGSVAVVTAGRRFGLVTRAERAYAAVTVGTAGGWLATAAAVSPWRSPAPQILIAGTLVLAVPWWAHRRRRARVRVERTLAAWPEIAPAVGLTGSRVMSAVVDVWGWRARLALARGQTINDAINHIPAIESGLGTFRGAVRISPTPDDLANRFELRVLTADPHADAITWPGPSVTSITQPVDLGPFEDATSAKVLFLRRHALFGGVSGSGKSVGLNVVMANLSACDDVVIWAIDLKRGVELGPWAPCIDRLATTPAEARALLADAVRILEARAEYLAATGRRTWQPASQAPALIIVIDEYAELAEGAPEAIADADSIARRGRAVAVTLIAATQRPTQKAMGQGAVRSQMDVRICFRVRERRDVDLIIGQGMLAAGWRADTLNAPGKFLMSAPEHDTPRRARAYLLTDEAVTAVAAEHGGMRPALDEISARVIGDRPSRSRPWPDPLSDEPAELPRDAQDSQVPDESPEALLWAALSLASSDGITVAGLMSTTGMSRRWIYYRLKELADAGRAVQTQAGTWLATDQEGHSR
jgi:hypothetical protein